MYYQIQPTPVLEGVYDVVNPNLGVNWLSGLPVSQSLPNPIKIELDSSYGTRMCDLFYSGILVMSHKLVNTLQQAGVTNLQLFPAVLTDVERGIRLSNYYAVQVIGRVQGVDLKKSVFYDLLGTGRTTMDFDKLVIDEKTAANQPLILFRLMEDASIIIIHEKVKRALDKEKWQFVSVHLPHEEPFPLDLDNYACRDDWEPPVL